jgi:uncharacterized protein with GYD domain
MAKIKGDYDAIVKIEDPEQREAEAKILLMTVEQTKVVVKETLTNLEKELADLMERTGWWATQDAVNSDIRGLRNGRERLLAAMEELEKYSTKIIDIFKGKISTEPTEDEPGE